MKANYQNKNKDKIEQELTEQLQYQFSRGLSQGCKAMCGVILEKMKKYDGTNANAIHHDVVSFCEKSLELPEIK